MLPPGGRFAGEKNHFLAEVSPLATPKDHGAALAFSGTDAEELCVPPLMR
jgi:hypothetical protein